MVWARSWQRAISSRPDGLFVATDRKLFSASAQGLGSCGLISSHQPLKGIS
jgi:hypothetical protein